MARIHWSLGSLACLSLTGLPLVGQDGVWRPVSQHQARYESADSQPGIMLGRPITGRSRVDQAVEPASFGADKQPGLALPAPPSQYEMLPSPRMSAAGYPQGMVGLQSPGQPIHYPAVPHGVVTYPNGTAIAPLPQGYSGSPVIVNGQVVNGQVVGSPVMGGTIVGDPSFGYPGMEGGEFGGYGGRYFQQAIHGSPGIWYGSLDFMLFSLSKDEAPPLVITGPQDTTSINSPGVSVLYGNGPLSNDSLYGGRVTMGAWVNRCQTWGMFGSFFSTATQNEDARFASDGTTFLARPFFNNSPINVDGSPHTPAEDIERVAQTGLAGSVDINRSLLLRGAELNFRFNLFNNFPSCRPLRWHVDGYAGVKYLSLDESLIITENLESLEGNPFNDPVGKRYFVQDSFTTRNTFVGGNIGFTSEVRLGRFFVETKSGLGIGVNMQEVNINGVTTISPPGLVPQSFTGGLLAQQSNIGQHTTNRFGIVPEFGLKMGLQVTDHMRVYAGYDMMYWANVVRPGQQIDYTVNASQLPGFPAVQGPARPAFNFNNSNLWISSFSAGLQWIF